MLDTKVSVLFVSQKAIMCAVRRHQRCAPSSMQVNMINASSSSSYIYSALSRARPTTISLNTFAILEHTHKHTYTIAISWSRICVAQIFKRPKKNIHNIEINSTMMRCLSVFHLNRNFNIMMMMRGRNEIHFFLRPSRVCVCVFCLLSRGWILSWCVEDGTYVCGVTGVCVSVGCFVFQHQRCYTKKWLSVSLISRRRFICAKGGLLLLYCA